MISLSRRFHWFRQKGHLCNHKYYKTGCGGGAKKHYEGGGENLAIKIKRFFVSRFIASHFSVKSLKYVQREESERAKHPEYCSQGIERSFFIFTVHYAYATCPERDKNIKISSWPKNCLINFSIGKNFYLPNLYPKSISEINVR